MATWATKAFTRWTSHAGAWGWGFPNRVSAIGGHFMFQDDQETPNDLNCCFQFDLPSGKRRIITFEVGTGSRITKRKSVRAGLGVPEPKRSANRPALGPSAGSRNAIGNIFYGSKGYPGDRRRGRGDLRRLAGTGSGEQPAGHRRQ